jgi:hypothetical protein
MSSFERPSDDMLEGNVFWCLQTSFREYWGKENWKELLQEKANESEELLGFNIRFRSHVISLPPNKDGYFFSMGLLGNPSQGTREMYTVGYLDGDVVYCSKLIVPELYLWTQETRTIQQCQNGLIRRINQSMEQPNQSQDQPS